MRWQRLGGLIAVATIVTLPSPVNAVIKGSDESGGGVSGGGDVLAWVESSGTVRVSGSGSGGSCVYQLYEAAVPVHEPGHEASTFEGLGGSEWAFVGWDCDGDGQPDGTSLVQIIDPVLVARSAWTEVRERLPDWELRFSSTTPVAAHWTTLTLHNGDWGPVTATATVGGVTATTTATPVQVVWDLGPVSELVDRGDLRFVTCDGPGIHADNSTDVERSPCKGVYATSSAGVVDEQGNKHRTTITARITWDVSFVASTGATDLAWFSHEQVVAVHNVAVPEVQAVSIG